METITLFAKKPILTQMGKSYILSGASYIGEVGRYHFSAEELSLAQKNAKRDNSLLPFLVINFNMLPKGWESAVIARVIFSEL
jgi:hypothetical protein